MDERDEFDLVAGLWRDGQARLAALEPGPRNVAARTVAALVEELQRRLGGPFTSAELAHYYLRHGTDWCFQIALREAPDEPEAWDMSTVANAAFALYLRRASDQGGGLRHLE